MDKRAEQKLSGGVQAFVGAGTALELFAAFLVVIPFTLWIAWARHSTMAEPVILTLFCLSFAWLNVSILRWQRSLRRLGWSSPGKSSFGLGPRPQDKDELDMWERGTHFRYSFGAVLLCMLAFGIIKWLNGG